MEHYKSKSRVFLFSSLKFKFITALHCRAPSPAQHKNNDSDRNYIAPPFANFARSAACGHRRSFFFFLFFRFEAQKVMSSIPLMAREEQLRYGAGGKALRSGRRRGGVYDRPLSGRHAPPELRAAADPRRQSRLSKMVDPPAPILKDSASSCFLSSPFRKSLAAIGPAPAPEDDSDASQKSHGQIDAGDYGSVTEDVRSGILRSEQICRQMLEIYFKLQNSNTKTPPINPSAPSDKFSCKKVLFQSSDNPWADDKETTNVANVPEIILISDDSDESDNERVEDDASTNSIEIEIFLDDFNQKYLVVDLKYESLS